MMSGSVVGGANGGYIGHYGQCPLDTINRTHIRLFDTGGCIGVL